MTRPGEHWGDPTFLPACRASQHCWVGGSPQEQPPCLPSAPLAGCHCCHQEVPGCFTTSEEHSDPQGRGGSWDMGHCCPQPCHLSGHPAIALVRQKVCTHPWAQGTGCPPTGCCCHSNRHVWLHLVPQGWTRLDLAHVSLVPRLHGRKPQPRQGDSAASAAWAISKLPLEPH